jgi:hypothetical protein
LGTVPNDRHARHKAGHDDEGIHNSAFEARTPRLRAGDSIRHCMTENRALVDKSGANDADDPFASFPERSNKIDEEGLLQPLTLISSWPGLSRPSTSPSM